MTDATLLARANPAGFAWFSSGRSWVAAPHLLLLSQRIVSTVNRRNGRLMVFMPPRHGKSELISRYTPPWFLGNRPDAKVMLASYADTFAASWGRQARDVFTEHAPKLFGQRVNAETAGGGQWEVAGRRGVMVTAGVGGGITGKGADLLIIDDPIKNAQDAQSETMREAQHDWWKSTARTRLQPGGSVILVMTRWHEDDLAGRLIKDWLVDDADPWEVLSLPGICEGNSRVTYSGSKELDLGPDVLGREPGDALWPDWFDLEFLEQTRRAQGSYWFSSMYQQRPAPAEGSLFQRGNFRYFERHEDGLCSIIRDSGRELFDVGYGIKFCTVDSAATEKTSADFTVVSTWVVTPNRDLLLWGRERHQFEGPEVKMLIRRTFYAQQPSFIGMEQSVIGQTIMQELVREGLPILPLKPDTDKISRALPACARYEEHRIFHPLGEAWVGEEWEPELLNFPHATHDDQVDTVAYAALQLPNVGGVTQPAPRGSRHDRRERSKTLTGGLLKAQL